jgi:hypothetical protein
MNTADWIAVAGAAGALAAAAVAALATIYGRKDARKSAEAAESQMLPIRPSARLPSRSLLAM